MLQLLHPYLFYFYMHFKVSVSTVTLILFNIVLLMIKHESYAQYGAFLC